MPPKAHRLCKVRALPFDSSQNPSLSARLEHKITGTIVDALGRTWNPLKQPRDSRGRFIETNGIARLGGGGLGRVVRTLIGGEVEVETRNGDSRVLPASRLTTISTTPTPRRPPRPPAGPG